MGVTYATYDGATLLHSDLYRYMQRQLVGVVDAEDWMILADVDEHLFVRAESGTQGGKVQHSSVPLRRGRARVRARERGVDRSRLRGRVAEDG